VFALRRSCRSLALIARRVDLNAGDSNQTETVQGRDRRSPLVLVWLEGRKADEMAGRRFRAQLCVAAFAGMVMIGRAACAHRHRNGRRRLACRGCRPLFGVNDAKKVGIMGYGVIDGRGYAKILHKDYSWWEMARKAERKNERYFTPRMIVAKHADGPVLYRIALHNSTNFHVSVNGTNGFTAWGVHLLTSTIKSTDAPHTDGIDPGSSTNITIAHSWIDNGDDNIAIKTGVTHMSVLDNHFYDGHGMSIGSETYNGRVFCWWMD
jgi:Glycosyl hydrolases family 28